MSNEELLKPRWKVIADYPKNLYHVGDILNGGWRSEDLIYCDHDGPRWSHYPHLFRKMDWWEERNLSNMPEYLKYFDENNKLEFVLKVEQYKSHRDMKLFWSFEYLWENEPDIKRMSLSGWLPATEEEYNEYCQTFRVVA